MAIIRTIKTKEEFIKEIQERISISKNLLDVYNNIYLPTLKEFDGKVYNIRFIPMIGHSICDKMHAPISLI